MVYTFITLVNLILIVSCASKFDNSIIGVPVISCERDQIRVEVETEKPFGGRIFVKGEFRNNACVRSYLNGRPVKGSKFVEDVEAKSNLSNENHFHVPPIRGSPPESDDQKVNGEVGQPVEGWIEKPLLSRSGFNSNRPTDKENETEWSGVGGAKSSKNNHFPFVPIFAGTTDGVQPARDSTEQDPFANFPSAPNFKVFPKKSEADSKMRNMQSIAGSTLGTSGGVLSAVEKYTKDQCQNFCEPCDSCSHETRRRRGTNRIELVVPLGSCNAKRDRTINPPTMTTSFVAVVSFHDSFITKLDRAYHIQCAYTEKNMPVSTELNVSMSSPSDLSGVIDPPVCQYKIAGTNGASIQNVRVGDLVRHEWICESPVKEMFSLLVHDCFVEDGAGERYRVVDEYGCSLDKYVLSTPQYSTTELSASVDAFMFKFPDKSSVDFQCSIKICSKEETDCNIITPPVCSVPRRRRSLAPSVNDSMTLHSNTLTVLDVDADTTNIFPESLVENRPDEPLCLSIAGFGILVSTATFLSTVSISVIIGHYYIKSLDVL